MKKREYAEPTIAVVALAADDVVCTSDPADNKQPVEMGLGVEGPGATE